MLDDAGAELVTCPRCRAALAPEAALCIACGYDLKLRHPLATSVERQSPHAFDPNPYASPSIGLDPSILPCEVTVFDLTEAGAKKAGVVVVDAKSAVGMILFAFVCAPLWVIMFPWYAYRLYCWNWLNVRFSELRNPSGSSPYAQLATEFQESRRRIYAGLIAGFIFWILLAVYTVLRIILGH